MGVQSTRNGSSVPVRGAPGDLFDKFARAIEDGRETLDETRVELGTMLGEVTAFRYGGGSVAGNVRSAALRMSFAAERPFYPYREPSDAVAQAGRFLHVYLISDGKMHGTLGDDAKPCPPAVSG